MAKKEKPKKKDAQEPPEGAQAPEGAEGAEGEGAPKKKLSGKTLILFIVLPALLILGGGGAAAFFLLGGKKDPAEAHGEEKAGHGKKDKKKDKKEGGHGAGGEAGGATISEGEGVFFLTLPDLLVNVTTTDGRPAFLKLKLTIEAPDEVTIEKIEPQLPRVMDQFQVFLRELRVEDLSGSAGSYRLRLELLRRVNLAIAPAKANAVLIEEMLVQ